MFNCLYCNKELTTKYSCTLHESKCKSKVLYEQCAEIKKNMKDLEKYKKENEFLVEKCRNLEIENSLVKGELQTFKTLFEKKDDFITDLAKQPKIVNHVKTNNNGSYNSSSNNIINTMLESITPLDLFSNQAQEKIKQLTEQKYTLEYYKKGQKGKAQFTFDHLLKDPEGKQQTVCGDMSRQHLYYKDMQGEIVSDIKAEKIMHATHPHIRKVTSVIFQKEYNNELENGRTEQAIAVMDVFNNINDYEDTSVYRSELSRLTFKG